MSDEKWILKNDVEWKRLWANHSKSWSSSKEDVVYMVGLEETPLLWASGKPNDQSQQVLPPIKAALDENHLELVNIKCIIFHQDNARPHLSLMTRQKLLQLGWETLIYPPYSLDITPSDFHLFQSLQYSLNGKKINFLKDYKKQFWLF